VNVLHDPTFWRAAARLLLAAVGAWFGFLGYKLFVRGNQPAPAGATASAVGRSGAGAGLFLIVVAGLAVVAASWPSRGTSSGTVETSAMGVTERPGDRAELRRQIAVLQQTEKQYQQVIRDLKNQLAILRGREPAEPVVVSQPPAATNAADSEVDINGLYSQMMDLSEQVQQLQTENEALRAELAGSRSDAGQ
jgi:uncharacterized protein HemX